MSGALEQVRHTEQSADLILSSAKEKIAALKQETFCKIKDMEDKYDSDLKSFQKELQMKEEQEVASKLLELNREWDQERDKIESTFASCKEDSILTLVRKVISPHGNSNC